MQVQNEINNDSIWRFIRTNDVLITLLAGSVSTLLSQLLDLQKCFYAYSMYDYYDIKQNMMLISTGHISLDLMFLAPMLGYVSYIIVSVKSMNKRENFRSCFLGIDKNTFSRSRKSVYFALGSAVVIGWLGFAVLCNQKHIENEYELINFIFLIFAIASSASLYLYKKTGSKTNGKLISSMLVFFIFCITSIDTYNFRETLLH